MLPAINSMLAAHTFGSVSSVLVSSLQCISCLIAPSLHGWHALTVQSRSLIPG